MAAFTVRVELEWIYKAKSFLSGAKAKQNWKPWLKDRQVAELLLHLWCHITEQNFQRQQETLKFWLLETHVGGFHVPGLKDAPDPVGSDELRKQNRKTIGPVKIYQMQLLQANWTSNT